MLLLLLLRSHSVSLLLLLLLLFSLLLFLLAPATSSSSSSSLAAAGRSMISHVLTPEAFQQCYRCAVLSLTHLLRGGRDRRSLLLLLLGSGARVRSFPRAPLSFLLEVAAQDGTPSAPFPPARLLSPLSFFSGAHQCSSVHPLLSHSSCTGKSLSLLGHLPRVLF